METLQTMENLIVKNSFDIDEDVLYIKRNDSDWDHASYVFFEDVKNRKVNSLSEKQRNWLDKIAAMLLRYN